MILKRAALVLAVATAFLIGYAGIAKAWPGVPDRNPWFGYFHNIEDQDGGSVISTGYPTWVNDSSSFIGFIENQLRNGAARDRTGAAFTIQVMLGASNGWSRNNPPTSGEIADWESRVRYAESQGWITWFANFSYTGNSYWQGEMTGSNPNDDAFYYENGTRQSMIFRNSSGISTVIKRDCGNPLTNGYMPGLEQSYSVTGYTTVSAANAVPGQTVTFQHYVKNNGPTTAPNEYWATLEGPSSAGTGIGNPSSGPYTYTPGFVSNVRNESFTIPNNAAAGTKYCREVGWDPINSGGARNGRGAEACTTVYIPAKLKAAMSVSPPTMAAGDTATFTPSISATTSGSPVTVNCSITRTLTPPTGGSSNLGNQPCVDTSGNSNITVNTGASVVLRANSYAAPDDIAVGSRVCDTITITNPSDPAYYTNFPGDQTSQACITIAKSPYVQFMGGDVWAGGGYAAVGSGTCQNNANITTVARSHPLSDGTTPGSGVAYAAFALGKITNFGSASMALNTSSGVGDAWTFSNTNSANLGYFGAPQHCISDYVSSYMGATVLSNGSTTVDVGGGTSGAWRINGASTFHGTMSPGLQKVYLVLGDVTIDNDIKYPTTYSSGGDIPSVVIITTGNIYVAAGVKQIDGIYETRGTFYTCYPKTEPATVSTCNNQLVVNGSVMANSIDLFRTAGAEGSTPATQKQPAETFNLSPEVYMTNALNQTSQTTLSTNNVRELPPRF